MTNFLKDITQRWLPVSTHSALQLFQLFRQGAAILIIVFLTKSSLSLNDIGTYEMVLYIGVTFSFFWVNGLLQGMLPTYPNLSERDQKSFFFNAYLIFSGISIVLFCLLYFGSEWVLEFMAGQRQLAYFKLYCIFLLINLPTYIVEYIYLLREQPQKILWFGLFAFGGQIVVVVFPVFIYGSLLLSFYGLIALAVVKHIWTLILLWNFGSTIINTKINKEYLLVAAPLMAYAFLGGFSLAFDQWLVNWHYDGDEGTFAIFRNGARELPFTLAAVAAFSATMIPLLAKNLNEGIEVLKKKTIQLYHFLFPLTILILLTSRYLFPIVFNEDFIPSVPVFNIYLLIIISRLIFPHSIIIAQKDTRLILWVSIFEISFNALLSFLLIQRIGLEGVAIATFVALLLEKLSFIWIVYSKYGIRPREYTRLNYLIGYSLVLLAVYFWVSF